MTDRNMLTAEFKNRLNEFQESYEWAEADGIVRSFTLVGELLGSAFDSATAAKGMQALRLVTGPTTSVDWSVLNEEPSLDWAEVWGDLDAYNDSRWSKLMEDAHNINAFAYFGIIPVWVVSEADRNSLQFTDVPAYVHDGVARLTKFVQLLPNTRDFYGIEAIERTCLAAAGRLKIDAGEPLSVHELAAVTQVTTKRLQNAIYAKSADAPIVGKDGTITVAAAQRWLEARDYKRSIWQQFTACNGWVEFEQDGPVFVPTVGQISTGDFLFVPEARDGTVFSPIACRRGGKNGKPYYTVGPKGCEVDYEDYEEALDALSKLTTPRWRRPNENGSFGIVSAERWRRLTREELFSI